MALSDAWLKANSGKPRAKTEVKTDRDGLSVRISPKGKIAYQLRYRYGGKACRMDLGTYPLLGLKAARAESQRLRQHLEAGHDPRVVLALEKHAIQSAATLAELFQQWYDNHCSQRKVGHIEILRTFELHVLPRLGYLPAEKISLHEWLDLLEDLAARFPGIADRVLTNTKQLYKWGKRRHLVTHNPLVEINAVGDLHIKKRATDRALSDREIQYLWEALESSRMAMKNRIFIKLCLIYGCRCGEVRLAERGDFDLEAGVWTVPPENHKIGKQTGKPLLRPIIPVTEALVREAMMLTESRQYLFTKEGDTAPMGMRAHLPWPYNIMQWLRRNKGYEMAHWSIHDLRRTARTNFSTLAPPHIAEIMLGHKLPGQWSVYDQYDYLAEQRAAYTKWWERLAELVG